MPFDPDNTQTSRLRLLDAGKNLFAQYGYEQTSTAAIARSAGTSESQLVRYFGGKAGLLGAIFNESWKPLNEQVREVIDAASGAQEALLAVFDTILAAFRADPDAAFLLLFEGRRVRSHGSEISLSQGFADFQELIGGVIRRGRESGTFTDGFSEAALAFALVGAAESLVRERLIAHRSHQPDPFTDEEIRSVFGAILSGLCRR